ncbi:MAG: DUF1552 domain-containing protein [Planctomycetota bacterium]
MLIPSKRLSRRHVLRGTFAAAIGLPFLEVMGPSIGQAAFPDRVVAAPSSKAPRRFVAMCATLGFHTPFLFPAQAGANYEDTEYLRLLSEHRGDYSVLSGLCHPEQQGNNGHASELTWLTSAQRPGLAGFRNTISLDQLIAQQIGPETRFPFLSLSTSGRSLSWTSNGIEIPGQTSPSKLFQRLFLQGSDREIQTELRQLKRGRSILDTIGGRAEELDQRLGAEDREKMDEYLTAVRDLEFRLQQSEGWVTKPKPLVDAQQPKDVQDRNDAISKQKLMYDMIVLALQTDSTRTMTFHLSGMNAVPVVQGVSSDWHGLSHHGKDPSKIEELKLIESAEFEAFADFLTKMKQVREGQGTLLDNTIVLFGSNLGNASAHDWHNLPLIVAGGGYRHGHHIAHPAKNSPPLANLFVDFAQQMGIEIDAFGSSTGTGIAGLRRT